MVYMKEKTAFARSCERGGNGSCNLSPRAFTLVELIVVISIISLLMSIGMPVFAKVRQNARWIITMNNQRQIVTAVGAYACNNENSYPTSVATIGDKYDDSYWNWLSPMTLTTCFPRKGQRYRAMSSYLSEYIDNPKVLACPNAPIKNKRIDLCWQAGENWGNPETNHDVDQLFGVYCFYWNYIGSLGKNQPYFRGPRGTYDSGKESSVLVSCYLGYNLYRSPGSFVSCERFEDTEISYSKEDSSDYWLLKEPYIEEEVDQVNVKLHAGFTDGHVEAYHPRETVKMDVIGYSSTAIGRPGSFYIPEKSLPFTKK